MKKFLAAFAAILASCFVVSAQNYKFLDFSMDNIATSQTSSATSEGGIWGINGKIIGAYFWSQSNMCFGIYVTNKISGLLTPVLADTTNLQSFGYYTNFAAVPVAHNEKIVFRAKLSTDSNTVADAKGWLIYQE